MSIGEFLPYLKSNTWQQKAAPFLTSAFNDGSFIDWLSKRAGGDRREARYCYPNILANIQAEMLSRFGDEEALAGGFLPRFLFTFMPRSNRRPARMPKDALAPAIAALERYQNKRGEVEVPEGYLQAVMDEFIEFDAPWPSHWTRLVNEYGPRFAVMLSVLNAASDQIVTLTDQHWQGAATLVRYFYSQAEKVFNRLYDDADESKREERVFQVLKYISKGPRTLAEISRRFSRNGDSMKRKKWLDSLVERGWIIEDDEKRWHSTTAGKEEIKAR